MQTLLQDLRFGFRMLRRSPGFSILAILCLTLGIGTTAAVFSSPNARLVELFPRIISMRSVFDRSLAADFDRKKAAGETRTR